MLGRCYNIDDQSYRFYGKRGIRVCWRWRKSFQEFALWALRNGYSNELTIDRVDNSRNYSPRNCRWATHKEQNRNKRTNIVIAGKCVGEWAEFFRCPYNSIWYDFRHHRAFSVLEKMYFIFEGRQLALPFFRKAA